MLRQFLKNKGEHVKHFEATETASSDSQYQVKKKLKKKTATQKN